MRKLIVTNKFKKAFKTISEAHPFLLKNIETTLEEMEEDVFQQSLLTHKLTGKLFGLKVCSCGHDCRIIFKIVQNQVSLEEEIILLNIGTHDIVY
jgi:addiction module RelE/StbE family toxin